MAAAVAEDIGNLKPTLLYGVVDDSGAHPPYNPHGRGHRHGRGEGSGPGPPLVATTLDRQKKKAATSTGAAIVIAQVVRHGDYRALQCTTKSISTSSLPRTSLSLFTIV